MTNMSGNVKRRLFSQLWEAASPFFISTTCRRPLAPTTSIHSQLSRKAFSQSSRPKASSKTPPKSARYVIRRNFASSGILLFGLESQPTATTSTITTCGSAIEKTLCTTKSFERRRLSPFAQQIWYRAIHSSSRRRLTISAKRSKGGAAGGRNSGKPMDAEKQPILQKNSNPKTESPVPEEHTDSPGGYFHLPHMPKMPHRPTKEELLAAATGFWSRLKVRFKWFSIRSVRPWNIDDWSAFVSWFVLGHIVWILVGTTTFFSLLIFAINTVVAQG